MNFNSKKSKETPYKEKQTTASKIKIARNGPYLVSGGVPLAKQTIGIDSEGYSYKWVQGENYPLKKNYALCRCGRSKDKPFCDGTHSTINFDGTETASQEHYRDKSRRIQGPVIDLTDAEELCAEARFCDRAGGIWKLTLRSNNPEARTIAEEEAGNCPSGRLVVWDKHGKMIEPEFLPSIIIVEDPQENMEGPIWVRGGILIESDSGITYELRNRVTLCRCGKSSNKPFCDGSHCTH